MKDQRTRTVTRRIGVFGDGGTRKCSLVMEEPGSAL